MKDLKPKWASHDKNNREKNNLKIKKTNGTMASKRKRETKTAWIFRLYKTRRLQC
jgi:L-asparaginase/Glu-tRNA(Gln) amidotransferase subunit D